MNNPVGKDEFIPIGKITSVHGLKGAVKVHFYGDGAVYFSTGDTIFIRDTSGSEKTFRIEWASPQNKNLLMRFKGVSDRSTSETLVGSEIIIEKAGLPDLEDGNYYWVDIIGLSVFTSDKSYQGLVDSVIPTGSNDVYVVKDGNKETLIPAIVSVVKEIDLKKKRMIVDLPDEL